MFDYTAALEANPNGVMATQDGNKTKTRVFQYLFSDDSKVYFCTSNEKPVYQQMQKNPYVSFCTFPSNYAPVVSVNGKVAFVDDLELKTRALDENPGIAGLYGTPDNPTFEILYLEVEEVETFSFADGPNKYSL